MAITKDTIFDALYTENDLGDIKPKIAIGGKSVSKFVPNVNISYEFESGNEKYFVNLNRKDVSVADEKESVADEKLSLKVGKETNQYHIEGNRLKWDIILDEKPIKNVWEFELKFSDGVSFYYQPALTQDEINEGHIRPDDVVGSYAVYCDKANHVKDANGKTLVNYRAGKLCHIYRPKAHDTKGVETWCELSISEGKLTVTVPQKYLDDAVYPVTIDPDFGHTGIGASNVAAAGDLRGSRASCPESGTADSMSVYILVGAVAENSQLGFYKQSDDTFVAGTEKKAGGTDAAWNVYNFSAPKPSLTAQDYVLCLEQWDPGGWNVSYDASSADSYSKLNFITSDSSWPSPFDGTKTASSNKYSVYLTYTASGGGLSIPVAMYHYMNH